MAPHLLISCLILPVVSAAAQSTPGPFRFEYDPSQPLAYEERLVSTSDGVQIYDSSFASPKGGRVQAYTVAPAKKGRYAGIVWQHGGGQTRNWFLPDAIQLARLGAVSILMNAPENRPPAMRRVKSKDEIEDAQQGLIQVAVDARRSFDVLAARADVDKGRIAYVGLSFGAMMGGSLAGTDQRFQGFVLICGLEGFVRHYTLSQHPAIVSLRASISAEDFKRLLAAMEPIDAKNHIGKSTAPMLFQAARFDPGVSESDSLDYFAMAKGPRELQWYNAGHDLNDPEAFRNRQMWLRKLLKMK